jgi:mannose-6-phosphate isomerase
MPIPPLYPLLFEPFFRPMPWGGHRLRSWFPQSFPPDTRIGEAWLLSDHPLHASRVLNGPLTGTTLRQLMADRAAELLGHANDRFPLLIKLLDANEHLSIQVHPDDAAARRWAPDEGGKTEAWVILHAEPHASLYLGLKPGVNRTELEDAIKSGSIVECLNRFTPTVGECWFVPAGTIHAIGPGVTLLEVQQPSDATFRLFDWGRVDELGKPRPLHLKAGLECLKPEIDGTKLLCCPADATDVQLVSCPFFRVERMRPSGRTKVSGPTALFLVRGDTRLTSVAGELNLAAGQLVYLSAGVNATLDSGPGGEAIAVRC